MRLPYRGGAVFFFVLCIFAIETVATPPFNPYVYFFVNDNSLAGDVYTTAIGSPGNDGLGPSTPVSSLQNLFAMYILGEYDVIYMDTGVYSVSSNITFNFSESGSEFAPLAVIGSTNFAAGGTCIDRTGTASGNAVMRFNLCSDIEIQNVRLRGGGVGALVDISQYIKLINVSVESNAFAGVRVTDCYGSSMVNCRVFAQTNAGLFMQAGNFDVRNSTFFRQGGSGIIVTGGVLTVSNSIISASGVGARTIKVMGGTYRGDYNNLFHNSGATLGFLAGAGEINSLSDWLSVMQQDTHSMSHDPLLANEAAGDSHLKSLTGRYAVTSGTFVVDAVHSPSIDAGSPASPYNLEPLPSGNCVNQGAYGNTTSASKSMTNDFLLTLSFNDGGIATGNTLLRWRAAGPATSIAVRVEFSENGGQDWEILGTNIPASTGFYAWDTFLQHDSQTAKWRIVSEVNSNVTDETDNIFAVAGGPQMSISTNATDLTLQWYGQTGRLYRVISPTGGLNGTWSYATNLVNTNGSLFVMATGANRTISVKLSTNDTTSLKFFGISASIP